MPCLQATGPWACPLPPLFGAPADRRGAVHTGKTDRSGDMHALASQAGYKCQGVVYVWVCSEPSWSLPHSRSRRGPVPMPSSLLLWPDAYCTCPLSGSSPPVPQPEDRPSPTVLLVNVHIPKARNPQVKLAQVPPLRCLQCTPPYRSSPSRVSSRCPVLFTATCTPFASNLRFTPTKQEKQRKF